MEVSFDSGDDEKGAPKDGGQRLNDFLALFVLCGRADLEPALNRAGSCFRKYNVTTADNTEKRNQKAHASQKCRVQAGVKSITAMMI
jgi:hypothetical protein